MIASQATNTQSFLRRNILLTTSNYSNKSSMISIKSSFIQVTRDNRVANKMSFNESMNDDMEENSNIQRHCCDSIN